MRAELVLVRRACVCPLPRPPPPPTQARAGTTAAFTYPDTSAAGSVLSSELHVATATGEACLRADRSTSLLAAISATRTGGADYQVRYVRRHATAGPAVPWNGPVSHPMHVMARVWSQGHSEARLSTCRQAVCGCFMDVDTTLARLASIG